MSGRRNRRRTTGETSLKVGGLGSNDRDRVGQSSKLPSTVDNCNNFSPCHTGGVSTFDLHGSK